LGYKNGKVKKSSNLHNLLNVQSATNGRNDFSKEMFKLRRKDLEFDEFIPLKESNLLENQIIGDETIMVTCAGDYGDIESILKWTIDQKFREIIIRDIPNGGKREKFNVEFRLSNFQFSENNLVMEDSSTPTPSAGGLAKINSMIYICAECHSENEVLRKDAIKCRECGCRILHKNNSSLKANKTKTQYDA
uniref:Uncharacterized protein n=1 Tax=Wuchereria bancrofti TaxID=6293 RepID=A0A1I8EAE5_WUCBA